MQSFDFFILCSDSCTCTHTSARAACMNINGRMAKPKGFLNCQQISAIFTLLTAYKSGVEALVFTAY